MVSSQRTTLGDRGEKAAAEFLTRRGFRVLHRQYRTQLGEIDLICRDGTHTVFVEVKTRRTLRTGHPTESITRKKQQQLTRLALAYLKRNDLLETPSRFDVVSVVWTDEDSVPQIEHFPDAFPAAGHGQMYS